MNLKYKYYISVTIPGVCNRLDIQIYVLYKRMVYVLLVYNKNKRTKKMLTISVIGESSTLCK